MLDAQSHISRTETIVTHISERTTLESSRDDNVNLNLSLSKRLESQFASVDEAIVTTPEP
jgi:hypothetical protein